MNRRDTLEEGQLDDQDLNVYVDDEEEVDLDPDHTDDFDDPCDCLSQECGYGPGGEVLCPECKARFEDLDLVCGDHGWQCQKCKARFTCP